MTNSWIVVVNGNKDILREFIFEYKHVYVSVRENAFEEMLLLNVVIAFYDRIRFSDVINCPSTCEEEIYLHKTKNHTWVPRINVLCSKTTFMIH